MTFIHAIFLSVSVLCIVLFVFPASADNATVTDTTTTIATTVPTTEPTTAATTATTIPTTVVTTVATTAATTATTVPATTATTVVTTDVTTLAATTATTVATTETTVATTTTTPAVSAPVASFTATPESGAAPLTVSFTDTSTNSPTSWSWTFGDGNTSSSQNPSFTYTGTGSYTVSLTVSNSAGSDTASKTITVSDTALVPVASFSQSAASGNAPLTILFTDASTNTPTSWSWSFGDGNTSSVQNPSYTYQYPGNYTVALAAANAAGSNTTTVVDDIMVNPSTAVTPVASFAASPTSGLMPLTVQFTDTSEYYPTSWNWYFGDGGTSTEENPEHVYQNPGAYAVALTASNAAGQNSSTQVITITASGETKSPALVMTTKAVLPEVSFTGTPTSGPAPLTVVFSAKAPGTPERYSWDFGDGGTSSEENPSYTYVMPGTYTVVLTVTYAGGKKTSTEAGYITAEGQDSAATPLQPATAVVAVGIGIVLSLAPVRWKRE